MVVAGNGFDVEVGEAVYLQLEGHSWLKMAIDGVLCKLVNTRKHTHEQLWVSLRVGERG